MNTNIFHNSKSYKQNLDDNKSPFLKNINKKQNVDINKLLNKVKIDQKNEKKNKVIFLSSGFFLLGLMGIFISLIR